MGKHIPYGQLQNRPCDFIVKYNFFTGDEGGRKSGPPMQGYRSDFMYAADETPALNQNQLYMIYPQFLDENGQVILDTSIRVAKNGLAQMWIVNENFFALHKSRINIGTKGFFMEGPNKVAECEVVEIVGLAKFLAAEDL